MAEFLVPVEPIFNPNSVDYLRAHGYVIVPLYGQKFTDFPVAPVIAGAAKENQERLKALRAHIGEVAIQKKFVLPHSYTSAAFDTQMHWLEQESYELSTQHGGEMHIMPANLCDVLALHRANYIPDTFPSIFDLDIRQLWKSTWSPHKTFAVRCADAGYSQNTHLVFGLEFEFWKNPHPILYTDFEDGARSPDVGLLPLIVPGPHQYT